MSEAAYIRRVAIAIGALILVGLAWWLSTVILLLFASVILSILVRALSSVVERMLKIGHGISIALALLGLGAFLLVAFAFFGWRMESQFAQLLGLLPSAFNKLLAWVQQQPLGETIIRNLQASGIASAMPTLAHIPGYALGLLGGLADLLLVAAGGIYLSIQPEAYYAGFLRLFSPTHRKSVRAVGGEIASNLRRWLFGQIAAMAIVGFMVGIAMWAIGVPAAGALGIFAGFAEFVPIAGPISATIPALLMALLIGIDKAGWTLLIFVIIQQAEGNIIIPIIQQRMVRIPPVVTIFAIVVFGLLFGLIGIVLATPLTIMASVLLNHYLHDRDIEA